jgi:hypothetical protein
VELFTVTNDQLSAMTDTQLVSFADEYLGIVVPLGTERTKVLTRIHNAAYAIRDGH